MKTIRINSDATIRREAISGNQYCVIVDDFLQDPHELVEFAANHAGEFSKPNRGYPGQQFGVNDDAMKNIYRFTRSKMTKHFPFLRGGLNLWTFLSMVTAQPDELPNLQRICHVDPNPDRERTVYAGLVYLFENEKLGGTGFYRWKERDLVWEAIAIESEDSVKGLAFLQEHFPTYRKPARYMTESNEIAELLCTIPARFNRLVFYSGEVPHSGAINAPELLSTDIRKGRLTLNIFANALPKHAVAA
jgi:hypothetical protein